MTFTKPILMRTGIASGVGAVLGAGYSMLPRCSSMFCKSGAWDVVPMLVGAAIFGLIAFFSPA